MVAFWIGIFFLVQVVTLFFVLVLCKSAAQADREFERALDKEHGKYQQTPDQTKKKRQKGSDELKISPDIIH